MQNTISSWLIDLFRGLEDSTQTLATHSFNADQSSKIDLQKLVFHEHPHKFEQTLVDPTCFTQDLFDLVKKDSKIADQLIDLYVATDGLFPGGHGFKNVQSTQRKVISLEFGKALSLIFGASSERNNNLGGYLLSPNERYYIYQMDCRVLGDEFWNAQRIRSKLENVENLHGQLIGSSQFYRNVWISSDQSLTPIHYDNSDNLFVQLFGKKHIILWKPHDIDNLYLNKEDHPTSDRQTNIDLTLDPSQLKIQFPLFFNSLPFRITLNPGDVMFIPKGWPHMVLSDGNSISLNYWWIGSKPRNTSPGLFDEKNEFSEEEEQLFSTKPLEGIKSLDDLPNILEVSGGFFTTKQLYPVPKEFNKYYHMVCGQTRNYYSINACPICNSRYHTWDCPKEDELYLKETPRTMMMSHPSYEPRNQKLVSSITSVKEVAIGNRVFSSTCVWNENIIVIGGPTAEPGQMIQFIDVRTGNVKIPNLKNTEGPFITQRKWGHSSTCVNDKVYIFGGFDSEYQYNDLICYDIGKSELLSVKTTGDVPSARAFHSSTYLKNCNSLLIYGGQVCKGGPYHYFNDLYLLNLQSFSWKKIQTKYVPDPLSQHSAIFLHDKNSLLVFGGSNSTKWFETICVLNLKTLEWKRIYTNFPTSVKFNATNFRIHPTPQSIAEINETTVAMIGFCDEGKGEVLLFDHNELSLRRAKQSVGWTLGSFSTTTKSNTIHVLNSNQQIVELKFDQIVLNPNCPTSDPHNWNYSIIDSIDQ